MVVGLSHLARSAPLFCALLHRMATAGDQLVDQRETNKTLNDQLSESEKQNAVWEAKVRKQVR